MRGGAKRAGISLAAAMEYTMARTWKGFYPNTYLQDEKPQQNGAQNGYKSAAQIRSEESQKQWDAIKNYSSTRSDAITIDAPSATFRESQLQLLENAK